MLLVLNKPRLVFTDDDLGQEGEQVYDRANGLNPEESEQVSNYLNKSVTKQGPSGEPPTEEEAAASRTGSNLWLTRRRYW